MAGLPGCGKSVVTRLLAERLDGLLLRTDAIRKELFAAPDYSPEESIRTYAEFYRRAEEGLVAGRCVIMDATFYSHASRVQAGAIAQQAGVPSSGVIPPASPPRRSRGGPRIPGGLPSGWSCKGWAGPFPWFENHLNQTNHAQDLSCRS